MKRSNQEIHVGDKVRVMLNPGVNRTDTPRWCDGYTGIVVRLNRLSATIRFDFGEGDFEDRRVSYHDIMVQENGEWVWSKLPQAFLNSLAGGKQEYGFFNHHLPH